MSKFGRRIKNAPEGYEYLEPTIKAIEYELRESMSKFISPRRTAIICFHYIFAVINVTVISAANVLLC